MSEIAGPQVGDILIRAAYLKEEGEIEGGFAGVFGRIAQQYFQRYGDKSDALARIADKNPIVAGPLRRTDCSLVSDGAAALVLADIDTALASEKAIFFRAAEQANDFLPMSKRDITAYEGAAEAWRRAFAHSGTTLDDLSCAEVHDCFTIAELLIYEAMGMAKPGEGDRIINEGISEKTGKLPINASGGLKAKGHPIGATGVSMHVLQSMQLTGTAGDIQIKDATLAGIFNMGGAAVANYVSILERLR